VALDENTSGLIGRIYESVEDPVRWEQVLRELLLRLDAKCAVQTVSDLHQCDMLRTTTYGDPLCPNGISEYQDRSLYAVDPSFRWAMKNPDARFCDTAEIVPAESYDTWEFFRWNRDEWTGSRHWVVGYTAPGDELTFGLSIHPSAEVGPLPADKKVLFKLIFEHMDRAIRLAARPPLFAKSSEALILLDRNGCIREISPAAQEVLGAGDGLAVWDRQLQAADSASTHRLNSAILSALTALREGGFGGAVALPRPSGKRDLLLTITPLLNPPSPFEAFRPAALVRIVDPERRAPPSAAHHWALLFGLTPTEARLADGLMGGDQNLRRTAEEMGMSYWTARVHLKNILEKTGTHSQSQLSRLLSRLE
jgi:DNA-binding CsgD family transcriptional regulator